MAGQFSRSANQRALTIALATVGASVGDQIATWNNGALGAASAWPVNPTVSALAKSIPANAWLVICSTTGTNLDIFQASTGEASAATSIHNAASGTTRGARANGDPIFVLQVSPYLALCTTAPTDSSLGTEYAATGYARQAVAWNVPTAADPPATQNTGILTFGPFTAGTGSTISYAALMDALSGGAAANMMAWWTLTTAKTPALNDSATVAASALTMTCT